MTYLKFCPALPLKIAALTTSRIYLFFFYLIDTSITHIEKKYVIKLAKNLNFCANRLVVKHRQGRSKLLA